MLDILESQIFSRIKYGFSDRISKKYPDLNFTTSDKASTKAKFPTVYVHMMESPEAGGTLEGTEEVGINATFQVDVSDNQNNNRTDEVANEVKRIMKTMRFKAKPMPFHNNSEDAYITTARYQRIIGSGDIL